VTSARVGAPGGLGRRVGLAFLLLPVVEIVVAILVARWIGAGPTVLLVLASSVAGLWLLRREGMGALRRWQLRRPGTIAAREVGDTGLRLGAALLLVVPGLLTAVAGLLLLVPPIRTAVALVAGRRISRRIGAAGHRFTVSGEVVDPPEGGGITVTSWVDDEEPPQLPPAP